LQIILAPPADDTGRSPDNHPHRTTAGAAGFDADVADPFALWPRPLPAARQAVFINPARLSQVLILPPVFA
jgi:hypothetical protein